MGRYGTGYVLGGALVCAAAGCGQLLGLGDFEDAAATGSGGATSASTSTDATSSSGGGEGGGSGGNGPCADGAMEPCYSGPAETEGVGLCVGGERTCEGGAWGTCAGEVVPVAEDCTTAADQDCVPDCGEHVWSEAFGPVGLPIITDVAMNAGGAAVVVGNFSGVMSFGCQAVQAASANSTFVAAFDGSGNCLWTRAWGGDSFPFAVAMDDAGSVVIAATAATLVDLGDGHTVGPTQGFVARLQPDGKPLWERSYAATTASVAIDPVGNVLVAGSFAGVTIIGGSGANSQGGTDGFVQKMDSNGQHAFALTFGSPTDDISAAVATDASGTIYVTGTGGPGTLIGSTNLPAASPFAARFTSLGGLIWAVGGTGTNRVAGICPDGAGGAFLGGTFAGDAQLGANSLTSAGAHDSVVAHVDSSGVITWAKRFGSDGDEATTGLALGPDGDLLVSGGFAGAVDFGGGTLIASGAQDAFLLSLDASGTHFWSRSFPVTGQLTANPGAEEALIVGEFSGIVDLGGGALGAAGENLLLTKAATRRPAP